MPQVHNLRTCSNGVTAVHTLASPALPGGKPGSGRGGGSGGAHPHRPRTSSAMEGSEGMPYSVHLETAGKQNEVRAAASSHACPRHAAAAARARAVQAPSARGRRHPQPSPAQVIKLKGALNEKEMELIELREQHMQLVVRSVPRAPQMRSGLARAVRPAALRAATARLLPRSNPWPAPRPAPAMLHPCHPGRRVPRRRAPTGRPRSTPRTARSASSRRRSQRASALSSS